MSGAIVVGTDGSDTARRAVDEAARLARAFDSELHVVTAYKALRGAKVVGAPQGTVEVWGPLPDDLARSINEEAGARVRATGVSVTTHLLEREPADALLQIADELDAELIVVGSQGMAGAKRLLGSVPNKVSHHAGRNVLIVSTDAPWAIEPTS